MPALPEGEDAPPTVIAIGTVTLVVLVVVIILYIAWGLYQQHLSQRRYLQLQEQQKREQDEQMAAAAERRAALNAKAQQRLNEAAARNADRGNQEVYKRAQVAREFAEKQRELQKEQQRVALEKHERTRQAAKEREEEDADKRDEERRAMLAAMEEQARQQMEAAQESADRTERQGKMMAKEAARRLAEYNARIAERERAVEQAGQRPTDVAERYSIKDAIPDAAKTAGGAPSPRLSPSAQRVVMPRRAWLPSKGWKSDREGGEEEVGDGVQATLAQPLAQPLAQRPRHHVAVHARLRRGECRDAGAQGQQCLPVLRAPRLGPIRGQRQRSGCTRTRYIRRLLWVQRASARARASHHALIGVTVGRHSEQRSTGPLQYRHWNRARCPAVIYCLIRTLWRLMRAEASACRGGMSTYVCDEALRWRLACRLRFFTRVECVSDSEVSLCLVCGVCLCFV